VFLPSPLHRLQGDDLILSCPRPLSEFLTTLPPSDPSAGSPSLRFFSPSTASPSQPLKERGVTSPRLRPQVFSTSQRFQQTRVPQLYFKPQPFLGFSSSERSPRRDRRPLSRPACSLALLPRHRETRSSRPYHPEFPGTPALLTRSPPSPRDCGFTFRGDVPLPARPGPCSSEPLAPPTSGASKPSSPCESVLNSLGHPRSRWP